MVSICSTSMRGNRHNKHVLNILFLFCDVKSSHYNCSAVKFMAMKLIERIGVSKRVRLKRKRKMRNPKMKMNGR